MLHRIYKLEETFKTKSMLKPVIIIQKINIIISIYMIMLSLQIAIILKKIVILVVPEKNSIILLTNKAPSAMNLKHYLLTPLQIQLNLKRETASFLLILNFF